MRSWNSRILECVMHIVAGIVVGIGFFSDEIYLTPLPEQYLPYCPAIVRGTFCYLPGMIFW